ncbi:hypothetical protein O9H85_11765 [Paenibacillus filicis]|uniref:Phage phiEco32-like COOH.NH2 ligase-type 2 n=1 Tax=Paenibacillus gyeongsangnamensis TaxID=3388067 RepID=A0ABT4Q885_9BACL|nr:hypothetical protein [Paenibacillus filicis]MCZ8513087.1 hypothetical protein [Paenibacillus filicis]
MRAFLLHSNEETVQLLLDRLRMASGLSLPHKGERRFVIHWGVYQPDTDEGERLQPVKHAVLAMNRARASQLLRLHGIECSFDEPEAESVRSSAIARILRAKVPGTDQGTEPVRQVAAWIPSKAGRETGQRKPGGRENGTAGHPFGNETQAGMSPSLTQMQQPPMPRETAAIHTAIPTAEGTHPQEERWSHEYLIPVFHLEALSLFHRDFPVYYTGSAPAGVRVPPPEKREFAEIGKEQPNYYASKAMREALKAVYALGLDYAVVRLGVRPDGTMAVRELQPVPVLTPRLAELFAEAMDRFDDELAEEEAAGKREVMLGADPEFLLLNERGKVIFASKYAEKEGPFGCDAIVLPGHRKIFPLAELRPRPSTDVKQLIINLHRTMQLAARQIGDSGLSWVAGGMPVRGFPLGGHIHFSGIRLSSGLLRALDNYLALPLTLIEDASTGTRKPRYGFLGDFRRQRHGGFEYRVLPSWMVSPLVTKGVLALAKLIAGNYRELPRRPLEEPEVQRAYYQGVKARIRPLLGALWRDLEKLPDYAQHETYLRPLRRMMLQMRSWKETEDFRPKWKISPFQ